MKGGPLKPSFFKSKVMSNDNIGAKLNVSQMLQAVIISLVCWQLITIQNLSEVVASSNSERQALKEDIAELKQEVKYLRNIVYSAIQRAPDESFQVK